MCPAEAPEHQSGCDSAREFLVLLAVERFDALTQLIGPAAAQALVAELREDVVRLWGADALVHTRWDHVAAVVTRHAAAALAEELATLAAALARAVDIDGYMFERCVAVGAADLDGCPATEGYGTARRALAQACITQQPVILPHARVQMASNDRLGLLRNLQRALRDDTLELHYQPKLRARTGEIAGAEGLIRWTCPEAGPIAPDRFIPLAEETGDIRELTRWVVGRALRDLDTLAREGTRMRLDVNMSGALLSDRRFTREIVDQLQPAAGMIGIEITETAMIADPERALANLQLCAEAGIKLAIDDYGAGFSSLAYLQQLPVGELKIDRSFIMNLASQRRDPLLVRSTIDLAHALEVDVTAEGVDAPQVLALLQVMGCDLIQGFYISPPLPLPGFRDFVTDASRRLRAPDETIERLRRRVDAARRKQPPAS